MEPKEPDFIESPVLILELILLSLQSVIPFRARYRRGTNYTMPVTDFYVDKIFSPAILNITFVEDFASLFNK